MTVTSRTPDSGQTTPSVGTQRTRTVLGTGIGNALEWFDWSIYATFAPFFAAQFFGASGLSAFLATLAVFGVGFVARPLGGIFFGRLADRRGRKLSLTLTVAAASAGSLMIAVAPGYTTIGVGASVILLVARIVQGLAHGGEQPAAQSYLAEEAPPERRGLWATLIYFSGTLGAVGGIGLGAVLTTVLDDGQMLAWGWRIPFVIGALGGLFALVMRVRMAETETFAAAAEDKPAKGAMLRELIAHRRAAGQIVGLTVGITVVYYAWVVAISSYAIAALGIDPTHALLASMGASLTFVAWLPLWGMLSDRIGRKPVLLIGTVGAAVVIVPLSTTLGGSAWHLFLAMATAQFFISATCAISPAVMTELFPTRIRTIGVALPLSLAVAVFGGSAPYLQAWVSERWGAQAFSWYVVGLLAVSAATILTLPETRGKKL